MKMKKESNCIVKETQLGTARRKLGGAFGIRFGKAFCVVYDASLNKKIIRWGFWDKDSERVFALFYGASLNKKLISFGLGDCRCDGSLILELIDFNPVCLIRCWLYSTTHMQLSGFFKCFEKAKDTAGTLYYAGFFGTPFDNLGRFTK